MKRYVILPLIVLSVGCDAEPEGAFGGAEEASSPMRLFDPECLADYEESGRQVREALAACESDTDCTLAQTSAQCIAPFQCSQAVARSNEAAFEASANQLVAEGMTECGNLCSVVDCIGAEQLRAVCDLTIGQCVRAEAQIAPLTKASILLLNTR